MDSHVHTIAILPPQDVKPTAKAEVTRIPSIHCTLLVAHHTTLANPSPPPSPASGEGYEDGDGEDGGGGEGGGGVGGESGGDNDRLVEAGPEMEFKSAQAAKVAKAANRPVTASRRAQVTAQLPQTEVGGAEPPDQGLSSEMPGVDFTWNRETLEVHEIFHDQLGTLVSEVFVMQDMEAVEKVLENVRDHYIVQKRLLTLPMLFLFNKVDEMIGGLHYSAMVAGADGKGVRFFEPSRGGIRERNLPMAKRVRQFLAGNSTELNLGIVHDVLPDQWDNHCPPQADGSEQEGMRCGHTLRGALLRCCGAAEVARIGKTKGDGGGGGPHQGPADPLATAAATTAAVGGDDRKRRRPAAKEAKGPTSGPPPLKKATVDSLSSSVSHRWSEPPSSSCTQTPLSGLQDHLQVEASRVPACPLSTDGMVVPSFCLSISGGYDSDGLPDGLCDAALAWSAEGLMLAGEWQSGLPNGHCTLRTSGVPSTSISLITERPTDPDYENYPSKIAPGYLWPILDPTCNKRTLTVSVSSDSASGARTYEVKEGMNDTEILLCCVDQDCERVGGEALPPRATGGVFDGCIYYGEHVTLCLRLGASVYSSYIYTGSVHGRAGFPFARQGKGALYIPYPILDRSTSGRGCLRGIWWQDHFVVALDRYVGSKTQGRRQGASLESCESPDHILVKDAAECHRCLAVYNTCKAKEKVRGHQCPNTTDRATELPSCEGVPSNRPKVTKTSHSVAAPSVCIVGFDGQRVSAFVSSNLDFASGQSLGGASGRLAYVESDEQCQGNSLCFAPRCCETLVCRLQATCPHLAALRRTVKQERELKDGSVADQGLSLDGFLALTGVDISALPPRSCFAVYCKSRSGDDMDGSGEVLLPLASFGEAEEEKKEEEEEDDDDDSASVGTANLSVAADVLYGYIPTVAEILEMPEHHIAAIVRSQGLDVAVQTSNSLQYLLIEHYHPLEVPLVTQVDQGKTSKEQQKESPKQGRGGRRKRGGARRRKGEAGLDSALLGMRQAEHTRRCQSGSMCQESAVQRAYAFELQQEISPDDPGTTPSNVTKPSPAATETTAACFVAQLLLSSDSICRHGVSGCYGLGSRHICIGELGELLGNHLALCLKCARRLYPEELADGVLNRGEKPGITLGTMGVTLIPIPVGIWIDPAPPTVLAADHTLRSEDKFTDGYFKSMQECQDCDIAALSRVVPVRALLPSPAHHIRCCAALTFAPTLTLTLTLPCTTVLALTFTTVTSPHPGSPCAANRLGSGTVQSRPGEGSPTLTRTPHPLLRRPHLRSHSHPHPHPPLHHRPRPHFHHQHLPPPRLTLCHQPPRRRHRPQPQNVRLL
jgi:hypothetical protein